MSANNNMALAARYVRAMGRIADRRIAKLRPDYRYAMVTALSTDGQTCRVVFPGDETDVSVKLGSVMPWKVNQVVRVMGRRGDMFVQDIPAVAGSSDSPGTIKTTFSTTVDVGWLLCDATVYNIEDYPDLWNAIGLVPGSAGDGITTFSVPDCRDRLLIGSSATKAVSTTGGTSTHHHSMSPANAQAYVSANATTIAVGNLQTIAAGAWTESFRLSATDVAEATRTAGAGITGQTDDVTTLPPWIAANVLIKY